MLRPTRQAEAPYPANHIVQGSEVLVALGQLGLLAKARFVDCFAMPAPSATAGRAAAPTRKTDQHISTDRLLSTVTEGLPLAYR